MQIRFYIVFVGNMHNSSYDELYNTGQKLEKHAFSHLWSR